MNIAFEISPLMTASGTFGDKSGVYRYTYGLISSFSKYLKKKDKKAKIILFSFNYDLLKHPLNPELFNLLKNKNVTYLEKFPKTEKTNLFDLDFPNIFFLKDILKIINKIFKLKSTYSNIVDKIKFNNYLKSLNKEFKKRNIDYIVHSETSFFPLNGYKNIITIYDLTAFIVPEFHRPETIDLQIRKLKFAVNTCQGIVCISHSTKNDLLNYFPRFKKKKIIVCHPGVEEIFQENTNQKNEKIIKIACSINNKRIALMSKKYLLYYGTFEPRKNLGYLVKAFLDLVESKKVPENFKLLMVGGKGWGNVRSKIIDYLKENYPTEEKLPIAISNFVNDKNLIKIIKNAYALVYPSFYEGFGLPILESMTLGTPVICSENSSLTEVGGNAVLYVNPRNFIDIKKKTFYLINNKKIANFMSREGLEQSEKFSWKKSSRKLYSFLEEI